MLYEKLQCTCYLMFTIKHKKKNPCCIVGCSSMKICCNSPMWPQQNNFMARDLSVQALCISKRAFIVHVKKERKDGFFLNSSKHFYDLS